MYSCVQCVHVCDCVCIVCMHACVCSRDGTKLRKFRRFEGKVNFEL